MKQTKNHKEICTGQIINVQIKYLKSVLLFSFFHFWLCYSAQDINKWRHNSLHKWLFERSCWTSIPPQAFDFTLALWHMHNCRPMACKKKCSTPFWTYFLSTVVTPQTRLKQLLFLYKKFENKFLGGIKYCDPAYVVILSTAGVHCGS